MLKFLFSLDGKMRCCIVNKFIFNISLLGYNLILPQLVGEHQCCKKRRKGNKCEKNEEKEGDQGKEDATS